LATAALLLCAAAAKAAPGDPTNEPCSTFGDLLNVSVSACAGFFSGNLITGTSGSHISASVASVLGSLSMEDASSASVIEVVTPLQGALTINFSTLMVGQTIIGIHAGQNAFPAGYDGKPRGGTAFYSFDAGAGTHSISLDAQRWGSASSNAAIYMTSAVPEPATSAFMVAGLGAVGFVARRRRAGHR
jgi:hypothetical protein